MKKNKTLNFIKFSLISFLTLFFLRLMPTHAEEAPIVFQPQIGIPGFDVTTMNENSTTYIAQMIKAFYDYGLAIGGILAAVVLMAGGLIWLTSAGSSDKITQAKSLIIGSITGIGLLFGAWIILNTINPALIDFKIQNITNINIISEIEICSKDFGPLSVHQENGKYFDRDGNELQGEKCSNQKKCVKIDYINKKDVFACTESGVLKCCQYEKSSTPSPGITCENVTNGSDCPETHNGHNLDKVYNNVNCDFQFNNSGRNPCYE